MGIGRSTEQTSLCVALHGPHLSRQALAVLVTQLFRIDGRVERLRRANTRNPSLHHRGCGQFERRGRSLPARRVRAPVFPLFPLHPGARAEAWLPRPTAAFCCIPLSFPAGRPPDAPTKAGDVSMRGERLGLRAQAWEQRGQIEGTITNEERVALSERVDEIQQVSLLTFMEGKHRVQSLTPDCPVDAFSFFPPCYLFPI